MVLRLMRANATLRSFPSRQAFRPATLRYASTITPSPATRNGGRTFWINSRALLLSAFVGSVAYVFGVTDAGNHPEQLWLREPRTPAYGKAKDLEKVRREQSILDVLIYLPFLYPNSPSRTSSDLACCIESQSTVLIPL